MCRLLLLFRIRFEGVLYT
ncbi:hypothetical protein F383_36058 [Gossypium arboreum]|uniref:Uncharacterized protein n=1 Tax=Gossypium arboreum TaxID=29729 RepID=A0A0B0N8E5_GOSAR|nr:hypothetical protein F383_36058 [Gossypium arboreum]